MLPVGPCYAQFITHLLRLNAAVGPCYAQFTHLLRLRNAPGGPCYAQFTHLLRLLNAPSSWTLLCTVYALASATPKLGMLHLDPVMHSLSICYAAPFGPYYAQFTHLLRLN